MTRHLTKLLDAIWYLSMGLFLGLTGGLVLSVILTFRGAREIDATPGAEPFSDPRFAEYHNDAVAGSIGQDLFMVGGVAALLLLGIALTIHVIRIARLYGTTPRPRRYPTIQQIQGAALLFCILFTVIAARDTVRMNDSWPRLYDIASSQEELIQRRNEFDGLHEKSESEMRIAWFCGLLSLLLTPWCKQMPNTPLQSGDVKEESNQEENREAAQA